MKNLTKKDSYRHLLSIGEKLGYERCKDKARSDAYKEAFIESFAESYAQEVLEIARKLKGMGLSAEDIQKATELSVDEIEKL